METLACLRIFFSLKHQFQKHNMAWIITMILKTLHYQLWVCFLDGTDLVCIYLLLCQFWFQKTSQDGTALILEFRFLYQGMLVTLLNCTSLVQGLKTWIRRNTEIHKVLILQTSWWFRTLLKSAQQSNISLWEIQSFSSKVFVCEWKWKMSEVTGGCVHLCFSVWVI